MRGVNAAFLSAPALTPWFNCRYAILCRLKFCCLTFESEIVASNALISTSFQVSAVNAIRHPQIAALAQSWNRDPIHE
jgi:hypothetical protein